MRWFQCKNHHLQGHDLRSILASPKGAHKQDYLQLGWENVEAPEQQVAFAPIQGIFQTSPIDENVSSLLAVQIFLYTVVIAVIKVWINYARQQMCWLRMCQACPELV